MKVRFLEKWYDVWLDHSLFYFFETFTQDVDSTSFVFKKKTGHVEIACFGSMILFLPIV